MNRPAKPAGLKIGGFFWCAFFGVRWRVFCVCFRVFFPHDLPLVVFLTLFLGFWVPPVFGFWVSGRNFLISGPPNFLVLIFEFWLSLRAS